MKRQVCYTVDISMDSDGVVMESQCECGAGTGPNAHCKHIVTILYALSRSHCTGEILLQQTCTQVKIKQQNRVTSDHNKVLSFL